MADLLSLVGTLGAAGVSSAAAMYNNSQNIKYAQEANDAMTALANTAHQREVRDFEAAGLNPILSATSGGAATPSLRTPNLESIDGGISHNARSLANALNGMTKAEVEMAKADATSSKNFSKYSGEVAQAEKDEAKARSLIAGLASETEGNEYLNRSIEQWARHEALTGVQLKEVGDFVSGKEGWNTYRDLVQMYRNQIEQGRYQSNVYLNATKDLLSGASSAAEVYGSMKRTKQVGKPQYNTSLIQNYDRNGQSTGFQRVRSERR